MSKRLPKDDSALIQSDLEKVTGGGEIKTDQPPSASVGQMSNLTTRQTTNNSFGTKLPGVAG